ncbi:MAG: LptF/LptG family permease [Phycisphaerae bacterium]|nr:LptF/LptG family permease [Phycisphaerae bacterium]
MKTLDRYVVRSFVVNMLLCLVVVMSLRIVIDLSFNMDEFVEEGVPLGDRLKTIGFYYACHSLEYYTELGGVAIVLAAAFTLARMNTSNELTAIMASGVSLRRVLLPIVIGSAVMSVLVVIDREIIIPTPGIRAALSRDRDDQAGEEGIRIRLMADGNRSIWWATRMYPGKKEMKHPTVILRGDGRRSDEVDDFVARATRRDREYYRTLYSGLGRISGLKATAGTLDDESGWLFTGDVTRPAVLCTLDRAGRLWRKSPTTCEIWSSLTLDDMVRVKPKSDGSIRIKDRRYGLTIDAADMIARAPTPKHREGIVTLVQPRFTFSTGRGRVLGRFVAKSADLGVDAKSERIFWTLEEGKLFHATDLTVQEMRLRESGRHLDYASSDELMRLVDLERVHDRKGVIQTRHFRMAEPLNNLVLLLIGVPFILSRERNVKESALMCLGISLLFHAFVYASRYFGLPPIWTAWLPVLVFGPVAAMMVDAIKT